MEKHTIPEKNLKDDGSITFDQTKDQYIKITIMEKQISAVEFLEYQIKKQGFLYDLDIEAAKELFKQQIEEAYLEACITYSGTETALQSDVESCKKYFNETFNQ